MLTTSRFPLLTLFLLLVINMNQIACSRGRGTLVQGFSTTSRCRRRHSSLSASTSSLDRDDKQEHSQDDGDDFRCGLWLPSSRIGSSSSNPIRFISAPMVGASDYAFRCLCRQYGVDLTYTQMLHSKNLIQDKIFQENHLDFHEFTCTPPSPSLYIVTQQKFSQRTTQQKQKPNENELLSSLSTSLCHEQFEKGPVMVQLAGHDAPQVVEAAYFILERYPAVTGIDLNCGCPQNIARKGNYGAFWVERDNGRQASRVLDALRRALPPHVSVSAKMRLPLNQKDLQERIQRLAGDGGIDFLTIHGRNLKENKILVGPVRVTQIQQAVQMAQAIRGHDFSIVANGGVEFLPDVHRLMAETGAVAVMSSEALLETPYVFQQDVSKMRPLQRLRMQFQVTRDYLTWAERFPPLPGAMGHVNGSFNVVRGHLFKFLYTYFSDHTDLRDALANPQLCCLEQAQELVETLYRRYVPLLKQSNHNVNSKDWDRLASSQPDASWYRRHWPSAKNAKSNSNVGKIAVVTATTETLLTETMTVSDRKVLLRQGIAQLQAQRQLRRQVTSDASTISLVP